MLPRRLQVSISTVTMSLHNLSGLHVELADGLDAVRVYFWAGAYLATFDIDGSLQQVLPAAIAEELRPSRLGLRYRALRWRLCSELRSSAPPTSPLTRLVHGLAPGR